MGSGTRRWKWILLAGAILMALSGAPSADASLIGDTIHVRLLFPDVSTVLKDYGNILVGAGVEIPAAFLDGFGEASINIGSQSIRYDESTLRGPTASASFNGFDFSDIDDTVTGATLSTNVAGLVSGRVAFGSHFVRIDLGSLTFPEGSFFQLDLNLVPTPRGVPEPATLFLLGSGLAGLASVAWRRHRRN